jgi:hypothetical protein
MTATALLLLCLLSYYVYCQHKARSRSLRALKANADGKAYRHYDTSERPPHLHDL